MPERESEEEVTEPHGLKYSITCHACNSLNACKVVYGDFEDGRLIKAKFETCWCIDCGWQESTYLDDDDIEEV